MNAPPPALAVREHDSLADDVLTHLAAQIASVQRLLEIVIEQGAAIRARDVHTVVRLAGMLHGELSRRELIEHERSLLLARAGERLGVAPELISVARLTALMDPGNARLVSERSAQLRGLLDELRREHSCNRAIMQIELSFLDHLMQSLALDGRVHGYDPRGGSDGARAAGSSALHVLDLEA
jgi:hypothetical protein